MFSPNVFCFVEQLKETGRRIWGAFLARKLKRECILCQFWLFFLTHHLSSAQTWTCFSLLDLSFHPKPKLQVWNVTLVMARNKPLKLCLSKEGGLSIEPMKLWFSRLFIGCFTLLDQLQEALAGFCQNWKKKNQHNKRKRGTVAHGYYTWSWCFW